MSVEVRNLSFSYGKREVLSNISFRAEAGELIAVMGPNGAGKSTLFRCILGLSPKYDGEIYIGGQEARRIGIAKLARHVAYIPQSHSPVFNFSVFDIVLMGTTSQVSAVNIPGRKQVDLANTVLKDLGIEDLKHRGYMQISGGERQLTMIARALAQRANILIMDEPTSNLDYGNQLRILSTIKNLTNEGYTIIVSTHNPDHALFFSDKVLALSNGRIVNHGSSVDVISNDLIKQLYDVDVEVKSLYESNVRFCIPKSVTDT
ncbi:MAG: ABC transporter ATP-binding protein [Clostridiales bacterium]|nr:ABC transporter ATP-binding protein [Clostridiales bacterium]